MFEMARDYAKMNTDFQVVAGYLSPVADEYKKPGLAPAIHRYNMCRLACQKSSSWLMVDPWEPLLQKQYSTTADVLDHFNHELNNKLGGVEVLDEDGQATGEKRKVRIMLLAGSDLIQTMSEPGLWDEKDVSFSSARSEGFNLLFPDITAAPHFGRFRLLYRGKSRV